MAKVKTFFLEKMEQPQIINNIKIIQWINIFNGIYKNNPSQTHNEDTGYHFLTWSSKNNGTVTINLTIGEIWHNEYYDEEYDHYVDEPLKI